MTYLSIGHVDNWYSDPGNIAENAFSDWAKADGWHVTKRGWPDFICRRGSEIMCVEVKHTDDLSESQRAVGVDLAAHGIPVYVWRFPGPKELEPISEVKRIIDEQELAVYRAADVIDRRSDYIEEQLRRAQRLAANRLAAIQEKNAEIKALQEGTERLTTEIGYLLGHIQDCSHHYISHRIRTLMRRYLPSWRRADA